MTKQGLANAYERFAETQKITPATEVAPRPVLAQMYALGQDVMSSVEALLTTYDRAQSATRESRGSLQDPETYFRLTEGPHRQFTTAFKSLFMFVRAYQDAVCGFLFELSGKRAGRYTSMGDALKDGKPTRVFLDEKFPAYREWFYLWKTRRDKIKGGGSFALAFDAEDNLSLEFLYPEAGGMTTEEQRIGLPDVIKGLEMSANVTVVAFSRAGELLFIDWPHKRPLPELVG